MSALTVQSKRFHGRDADTREGSVRQACDTPYDVTISIQALRERMKAARSVSDAVRSMSAPSARVLSWRATI